MTMTRKDLEEVADELEAAFDTALARAYRPRWNLAPTDPHFVMIAGEPKAVGFAARPTGSRGGPRPFRLEGATWGFAQGGSRGRSGPVIINARSETARFRDVFREAFVLRRCVVPADGFYEWAGGAESGAHGGGQERRPHWIRRRDGKLLLFAGLWQEDVNAPDARAAVDEARPRRRFVVLTTAPNTLVGRLHDRMPAVLSPEAAAAWLAEPSQSLLGPAPEDWLEARPVSRRVNSVKNDDAGCLDEAETPPAAQQLSLF